MKEAKKTISFLLILFSIVSCDRGVIENEKSRFFIKLYGNLLQEEGIDIAQTADGGYILFGSTNSSATSENGNRDLYLVRTNAEGNVLWQRSYGGPNNDVGVAMAVSDQGYYIVGTQVTSNGTRGIYTVFVGDDITGNMTWDNLYGSETADYFASDIVILSDGNLVVTGTTTALAVPNPTEDEGDITLIKFDSQGQFILEYTVGGSKTKSDFGKSGIQTNDSRFVVFGSTYHISEPNQIETNKISLQKTDIDGKSMSDARTFWDLDGEDHLAADFLSLSDGYIIAGNKLNLGSGDRDVFIHKVDKEFKDSPSFLSNPIGLSGVTSGDDEVVSLLNLPSGFLALGNTNSFSGSDQDIFLVKYSDTGEQLWETDSRIFGANGDDLAGKVIRTMDGGLAMICTISVDGRSDVNRNTEMCLIKMNANGEIRP